MAIPKRSAFVRSILDVLAAERAPTAKRDLLVRAMDRLRLTPSDMSVRTRGGTTTRAWSESEWALTYARKAGLVASERGLYRLSDDGERLLNDPPSEITGDYLMKYPEFAKWSKRGARKKQPALPTIEQLASRVEEVAERGATVEERLDAIEQRLDAIAKAAES